MAKPAPDVALARRAKALDTLSVVGAAPAGLGLGALAAGVLKTAAAQPFAVGLFAHLGAMTARRRLDADRPAAWWEEALYWGCWAAILPLAGYLALVWLTV
ncbi:MAG: hypothetical protein H2038_06265 [Brevundimonas sp.]|jgi:hypothetical protein|nr:MULTISPECIES: hypothetical protein [Brevundimonas]MBA4804235.1 hypothetical protein [Brevundimonas sp.]MBN8528082.1 hypothetical protein [Caulobacterales bacterium]